jgi:hypothetical protein
VTIEVRSGETTLAEVPLVHAQTVVFDFRVPEGDRAPSSVLLEVRDSAGALAFVEDGCRARSSAGHDLLMTASALPLGRFAFSARSDDGWAAAGELEVAASGELQQRVTVLLSR